MPPAAPAFASLGLAGPGGGRPGRRRSKTVVLVARTSARRVAELLRVDPGTAAAALRALRQEGVLALEREKGTAGRFGLSVYVLRPIAGFYVLVPGGDGPAMAPPSLATTDVATPVCGTTPYGGPMCGAGLCGNAKNGGFPHGVWAGAVSADLAGTARASRPLANPNTVGLARPASPWPADVGTGRRRRMTAARVASPEGWQVSVAVFLVGFGGWGPTVAVGLDSWG